MSKGKKSRHKQEEIDLHNAILVSELKMGDLVEFPRKDGYSHWGVYVGDGQIVHLTGENDDGINASHSNALFSVAGQKFNKAMVLMEEFGKVAAGEKAFKNNMKDGKFSPLHPEAIVQSAMSKLGRVGYNVMYYNCEHFASLCRYGKKLSEQVDKVTTSAVGGGVGGGLGGVIGAMIAGPGGALVGATVGGAAGAVLSNVKEN